MALLTSDKNVSSAIEKMLKGLAFWIGYCKVMNELYEHDCVHQAYAILRANLGRDRYALRYEYKYSDIDHYIDTQERADLVILDNTQKKKDPICVMEFKMSDNSNGGVGADMKKLRMIKNTDLPKFVILLFDKDNPNLVKRFTERGENSLRAKRVDKAKKDPGFRVRRVAKAMATADNPKRNPYMAVCIEVH